MEEDRYLDLRCGLDAKSLCHQTKVFSLFDLAEDINRLAQHAYRRLINDNGIFSKESTQGIPRQSYSAKGRNISETFN